MPTLLHCALNTAMCCITCLCITKRPGKEIVPCPVYLLLFSIAYFTSTRMPSVCELNSGAYIH